MTAVLEKPKRPYWTKGARIRHLILLRHHAKQMGLSGVISEIDNDLWTEIDAAFGPEAADRYMASPEKQAEILCAIVGITAEELTH